jgi:hypothetical protein
MTEEQSARFMRECEAEFRRLLEVEEIERELLNRGMNPEKGY